MNVYLDTSAEISSCGTYRYVLRRRWAEADGRVLWVMLNPSVADAAVDDATVRKCVGFSKRWGYAELAVVNLYAYRATDPRVLKTMIGGVHLPRLAIGPENDDIIDREAGDCDRIVLAWGSNAIPERAAGVYRLLMSRVRSADQLHCLGRTLGNQPRHPLMIAYSTPPEVY